MKESEQARGTHNLESTEGRTSQTNERKQVRGTYRLESAERETSQVIERMEVSNRHLQTEEHMRG